MIYSGTLDEWLDFYKIVEVQSESGFKQITEVFRLRTKAYRFKNKENYVVNADELFHSTELRFQMRYRKIDETDIVYYDGNKYRITSLCPYKEDNQITIILAKIDE